MQSRADDLESDLEGGFATCRDEHAGRECSTVMVSGRDGVTAALASPTIEGARVGGDLRNVGRCLSGGNRAGELRLFRAVIAGVGGHDEIACSPTSSSSFASSLATPRSPRHRPPLTDAAPDPARERQEENLRKNLRR